jgi:hypothetical protein
MEMNLEAHQLPVAMRAEEISEQDANVLFAIAEDPNAISGRLKRTPRRIPVREPVTAQFAPPQGDNMQFDKAIEHPSEEMEDQIIGMLIKSSPFSMALAADLTLASKKIEELESQLVTLQEQRDAAFNAICNVVEVDGFEGSAIMRKRIDEMKAVLAMAPQFVSKTHDEKGNG